MGNIVKKIFAFVLILGLFAFVGCTKTPSVDGGDEGTNSGDTNGGENNNGNTNGENNNGNTNGGNTNGGNTNGGENNNKEYPLFNFYGNLGQVSCEINYVQEVERHLPIVSDGGLDRYPIYNNKETFSDSEKQAILAESNTLFVSDSTYDSMDKDGNLYLKGVATGQKLYKHSASTNMYLGDVSDTEKAYETNVKIKPRQLGTYITGMYAPAGEVIKIEISKEVLDKIGGVTVVIGQISQRAHLNNIPLNRAFTRMPQIANKFWINSEVTYIGNYFGGPIYIGETQKAVSEFEVTISGGCKYPYFILGETTYERFEDCRTSTAPYFDFETFEDGVRHSGPYSLVSHLSYDDLYKMGVLWEKLGTVSNQVPSHSHSGCGISCIYDTHVQAGEAVALIGANYVNSPLYWMVQALDYNQFVNDGSWGVAHEYNHHYQVFGINPGKEITNNAVTLVEYSMFTDISSKRNHNDGSLKDWNVYTDSNRVLRILLNEAKNNTNPFQSLAFYGNILGHFGQDVFLKATKNGSGLDNYFNNLVDLTGFDMTYVFKELLNQNLSEELINGVKAKNLPMYVPVTTIYQTGVKFSDYESNTMRPYQVNKDGSYTLDFTNYLTIPEGFTYTIKSLTSSDNITIGEVSNGKCDIKLNSNYAKCYLTLEIDSTYDFEVEDVTLVLEFTTDGTLLDYNKYYFSKLPTMEYVLENGPFEGDNYESGKTANGSMSWIGTNVVSTLEGSFVAPSKGTYRFSINGNIQNLLQITHKGVTHQIRSNSREFVEKIDLELEKGEKIDFSTISLSTLDTGWIQIVYGILKAGECEYKNLAAKDFNNLSFESNNPYEKVYSYNGSNTKLSLVSYDNFNPWDNNYKFENLFDGISNNFIHSTNNPSVDSPITFVCDLGDVSTINYVKFYGYNRENNEHVPTHFKLYSSLDGQTFELIGEFKDVEMKNRNTEVYFDAVSLRYIKVEVLRTSTNKYFALNNFEAKMYIKDAKMASLAKCEIYGDCSSYSSVDAYFGQIVTINEGYFTYTFEGDSFGIVSKGNATLKVTIDDKSYDVNVTNGQFDLSYYITNLSSGSHNVKVEVIKGNIDLNYIINK